MSRHFFVFGIARSGTNLLARMIDRHPAAVCALDPLLPYFKFLRNGIVDLHAPAALRETFSPNAPLQDYYFQACGPALLDVGVPVVHCLARVAADREA